MGLRGWNGSKNQAAQPEHQECAALFFLAYWACRTSPGSTKRSGFGVEAIDDLVIAVAQACQNAIAVADRTTDRGRGQIRLSFKLEDRRLEVQVRSICAREGDPDAPCGAETQGASLAVEPIATQT